MKYRLFIAFLPVLGFSSDIDDPLPTFHELNVVYHELENVLNAEWVQGLVQAHRDWLSHRDIACGNNGNLNVECYYRANRERIAYLNDRLRECNAGHCQIHAMTKQGWYTY